MSWDRSDSGDSVERPKSPERLSLEFDEALVAADRTKPWEQVDPGRLDARAGKRGELPPTPEELAALRAMEPEETEEAAGTAWQAELGQVGDPAGAADRRSAGDQSGDAGRPAPQIAVADQSSSSVEAVVEPVAVEAGDTSGAGGQERQPEPGTRPPGEPDPIEPTTQADDQDDGSVRGALGRADGDKETPPVTEVERDGERRDPERLHTIGIKDDAYPERRLQHDFPIESIEDVIGPYAPTSPTDKVPGASTYIDIDHPEARVRGQVHRLPPDYEPPEESGLAIHADGRDVAPDAPWSWGHRTIYPTEPMTAAEFAQRVSDLPWEYVGKKKE